MAQYAGSIPYTGYVAPADDTDTYAVTKEEFNQGGYRAVADSTARLAITSSRRKVGMLVKQLDTGTYWTLSGGILDANWAQTLNYTYTLPLAASGTRGGVQIGYTPSGANLPLQLSAEMGYIALTKSAIEAVLTGAITSHTHSYQPLDSNLTAIAGLSGTSGLLKKTAANTWVLDGGIGTWGQITGTLANQTDLNNALGLKADLVNGIIPSNQLPSYVDDVLEYSTYASLPTIGESGKIYVTLDSNLTYRWTGSAYTEISKSLALGTTSSTAFRGDYGNTAYDYSQIGHLPLSGGSMANTSLVTNMNADLLDGYHLSSVMAAKRNLINNENLDNLKEIGSYVNVTGNGSGNSNFITNYGIIDVTGNGGAYGGIQKSYTAELGELSFRMNWDGWSPWRKVWDDKNANLSTVDWNAKDLYVFGNTKNNGILTFGAEGYIYTYGRSGNSNGGRILLNNGTAANFLLSESANNIYSVGNGANNLMNWDLSAMRVGIGTAAPNTALEVNGDTRITRPSGSDTYLDITIGDTTASYNGYDPDGYMSHIFKSNGVTKMTLDGSGNLTVTGVVKAYRYSTANNLPAIILDKPGSYAYGLGPDGTSMRVRYGAINDININNNTWVDNGGIEHYFDGTVKMTNSLSVTGNILASGSFTATTINANGTITGQQAVFSYNGSSSRLAIYSNAPSLGTGQTYPFSVGRYSGGTLDFTIGSDSSYVYFQSWNSMPILVNSQGNAVIDGQYSSLGAGTTWNTKSGLKVTKSSISAGFTLTVSNLVNGMQGDIILTVSGAGPYNITLSTGATNRANGTLTGLTTGTYHMCFTYDGTYFDYNVAKYT